MPLNIVTTAPLQSKSILQKKVHTTNESAEKAVLTTVDNFYLEELIKVDCFGIYSTVIPHGRLRNGPRAASWVQHERLSAKPNRVQGIGPVASLAEEHPRHLVTA